MKRVILSLFILSFIVVVVEVGYAQDATNKLGISMKQGLVLSWKEARVKNLTTFEVAKTKPVESWGKWNALWSGWTLDAGFAYDAATIDTGALLIGREFGTLGKYFPIDFPLKDKITITIYPVGLYVDNLWDKPTWHGCSGGAIIKFTISLG